VEKAEEMHGLESNSMDLVVHTFILCEVDDAQKVLDEIYRVLKPGGVCVFLEHSLADKNRSFLRFFQQLIEPVWYAVLDCKFKNVGGMLNLCKYDKICLKRIDVENRMLFLCNPICYGYASKKKQ